MAQLITVRPLGEGWTLDLEALDGPMVFRSGAAAERAARQLAVRLSDAGQAAELVIQLRDGAVATRFITSPAPASLRT